MEICSSANINCQLGKQQTKVKCSKTRRTQNSHGDKKRRLVYYHTSLLLQSNQIVVKKPNKSQLIYLAHSTLKFAKKLHHLPQRLKSTFFKICLNGYRAKN